MGHRIDKRLFTIIPAIIMAVIIFVLSSQNADQSSKLSEFTGKHIISSINDFLNLSWTEAEVEVIVNNLQSFFRKAAHVLEYFVFTLLLFWPLIVYRLKGVRLYFSAISISVVYAVFDEFHQLFVRGRAGQVTDIFIDGVGILATTLAVYLARRKRSKAIITKCLLL